MTSQALTFPNFLTLTRLILSPLLVPILFVHILPLCLMGYNIILALLFILLSLTDFFDGYLARLYKQETLLGRLLDPLADKFLLFSSLIALVYVHRIYFYWAIILVGREFFIMGLREIALHQGFNIPVSLFGKIKTILQVIFITFVIINPYADLSFNAPFWNGLEHILLSITLFFTVFSAYVYWQEFMKRWKI